MRLATLRTAGATRAVRIDEVHAVDLGHADVGSLLAHPDWPELATADGPTHSLAGAEFAPVVSAPGKIWCVGLNYRGHILEMGRELPEFPTLFAKFADALIGPNDPIMLPPESDAVDWEAELAVVIGRPLRRASPAEAAAGIAGFTVANDVTARDWQFRTREWLQGKTFEATTPIGPVLVTPDELPGGVRPRLDITGYVDGRIVQQSHTADLVFDPLDLVCYISTITTLRPGDVILTGTPAGVGHARTPAQYLRPGNRLITEVSGIGRLDNRADAELVEVTA